MPIRTIIGHGVIRVHHSDHSGQEGDALPAETIRVPFSVPALMMMPDLICDPPELIIAAGNFISFFRMGLQDLPFFVRKFARLIEYFQRNSNFADVMQETEQRQFTLLNVRQLNPLSQFRTHQLCAAHMVLRVTVAFLKRPDQRCEHFRMDGFPVKQLLGPHRFRCHKDGLLDIRIAFGGNADRILNFTGETLFHPGHVCLHRGFVAVAAQCDEVCLQSPHIIGLLRKALPHGVCKHFDCLVSSLVTHGAVDHRQAVDVTDRHRCGAGESI